ncbi:uncharacterized protein V1510DRAFT_446656 [Dipodascopsis tothii]|uniref:uncharacterized protein n=1 Tax=Dipodascopsis tothii TaxID=44089 RepID=UPI0034CDA9DD
MFVLAAQIYAQEGKLDDVFEALVPEAAAVKADEEKTHAYYFFKGLEEPNTSTAFGLEIYDDRHALETIHMGNESFKTFAATASPMFSKDFLLEEFETTDIGFVTRPGYSALQAETALPMFAYFTVAPGKREEVLDMFRPLATEVEATEPNCWSYVFFRALNNPDKFVIFERYTTLDDLNVVHRSGKTFIKVFAELEEKGLVVDRNVVLGAEARPGALGFLDRS